MVQEATKKVDKNVDPVSGKNLNAMGIVKKPKCQIGLTQVPPKDESKISIDKD